MNRNTIVLLTFLAGTILIYSGIQNVSPIDLIRNTLQGKPTVPKGEFDDAKFGDSPTDPSGGRKPKDNEFRQPKPLNPGFKGLLGNGAL